MHRCRMISLDHEKNLTRHPLMLEELMYLQALLARIGHPRAGEIEVLIALYRHDRERFWDAVNSNSWWAGAGSMAAETLNDNPGMPDALWQAEVREFRERLIAIGEILRSRGGENPGISSWLLAFQNWNAAGC
jgi:hypothetical protein